MGREKGSEKTGGRTKGTPNKTTAEHRLFLSHLLSMNEEQFLQDLQTLNPQQRVNICLKLYGMILPHLTSVTIDETPITTARDLLTNIIQYKNE